MHLLFYSNSLIFVQGRRCATQAHRAAETEAPGTERREIGQWNESIAIIRGSFERELRENAILQNAILRRVRLWMCILV